MKVLVGCEFSGIVREAFAKQGHDAWSCDILPTEIPSNKHIVGDILLHLNNHWDLFIGHPPCTYLSNAAASILWKNKTLNKDRYILGMKAKEFFMKLLNAPIGKIAIENPVQSKVFGIPLYTQIIQPYQFGHPYSKKTCLWLKNLPKLQATTLITENIESTKIPGNWYNKGGKERQKNRSRTFQGIASAMASQWGV